MPPIGLSRREVIRRSAQDKMDRPLGTGWIRRPVVGAGLTVRGEAHGPTRLRMTANRGAVMSPSAHPRPTRMGGASSRFLAWSDPRPRGYRARVVERIGVTGSVQVSSGTIAVNRVRGLRGMRRPRAVIVRTRATDVGSRAVKFAKLPRY